MHPEHNVYMQLSWKRKVRLEEHVWKICVCSFQMLQLLSRQCVILNIYSTIDAMPHCKKELLGQLKKVSYLVALKFLSSLKFKI